jgi:multidrug efflux pump subunit AcrB
VSPTAVLGALGAANRQVPAGSFSARNAEALVEAGSLLRDAEEVGDVVVGVFGDRPVHLRDVARVEDGPEEPATYVFFGAGAAAGQKGIRSGPGREYPAVTVSVAKRKGTNAIVVADRVMEKVEALRGRVLTQDVNVTVTRNYGETANEKSNELLEHMLIAVVSVTVLIALALGKRESGVVALAVPVTLALTLVVFALYGYTLNRITLFALIFSIGILVDDAIVVVENIVRHLRMASNRGRSPLEVSAEAVDEVGNPTVLATFTVIAAIVPMGFVGGLMGPYMRPIPVGASAAMIFSLLIAFIISPWAAYRLLKGASPGHRSFTAENAEDAERIEGVRSRESGPSSDLSSSSSAVSAHSAVSGSHGEGEDWTTRLYRRMMVPLIRDARRRMLFLAGVVFLLLASMALVPLKAVTVKMLPFDNKSEFQVIVDTPEGTTLEQTTAVARAVGEYVRQAPEVTDYQVYAGTAGPYNFNGLVRHYFLRRGPNVADVQVNLASKGARRAQSHEIAKRLRPGIAEIARRAGARVKVAEVPPGPPVLSTLVAEVYGPDYGRQIEVARQIEGVFEGTEGVVDVDTYIEDDQPQVRFVVDREKAALNGVSAEEVAQTLRIAVGGAGAGLVHLPAEQEDVPIFLRLPISQRSSVRDLSAVRVRGAGGRMVPLGELARVEEGVAEKNIYHKNLKRVVYVTGDVAGRQESPVYAILKMNEAIQGLRIPEGYEIERHTATQPFTTDRIALKWDGEWHITYEVFRDLGLAFGAVLVLIYILVVAWFQSFKTPVVIMSPIPLTLIGILPAHALLGAFFTATSMIGFIAGAGIIVRNSIILVDFIELRLRQGMPLAEAVVDAGAVRFRPMLLTAAAVIVGSFVILFDPIFQGLAVALMAGEVASTLLSRMAVPVLYYMANVKQTSPTP